MGFVQKLKYQLCNNTHIVFIVFHIRRCSMEFEDDMESETEEEEYEDEEEDPSDDDDFPA